MTSPASDAVTDGHALRSRRPDGDAQARREAGDGTRGGHGGGGHNGDRHAGSGGDAGDGGRGGDRHGGGSPGGGHSAIFLAVAGTLAIVLFLAFVALGTWQLKRRVWKLDLIARVEQRVHAPPVAAPGPAQWPKVSAATDEYRHVTVTGSFLDESQTLVQALTDLGAGYWVLTPLRTADGSGIVLVNRGFIPADDRDRVAPAALQPSGATNTTVGGAIGTGGATDTASGGAAGTASDGASGHADMAASTTVTGLLRMTEPRGAFLRHNDAAANHWYSRDVQAIAAARGLTDVAPYFIDAEAAPPSDVAPGVASGANAASAAGAASTVGARSAANATSAATGAPCRPDSTTANAVADVACAVAPVGGLTVITFHNSHLVYAITWYTLALMVAGAIWLGVRREPRK